MGASSSSTSVSQSKRPLTVVCDCEKVKLTCVETQPRFVNECCCRDCCIKLEWTHSQGANIERQPTASGPNLNVIVGNRWLGIEGRELIKLYKMTEKTKIVFAVADCCKTFLMQ